MVNLLNCSIEAFMNYAQGKRVYSFGNSHYMNWFLKTNKYNFEKIIYSFTDNNPDKCKTNVVIKGRGIPVISVNNLTNVINKDDVILISTGNYYFEILKQLDNIEALDGIDCFLLPFIQEHEKSYSIENDLQTKIAEAKNKEQQIPKKIHYCWFGENPIPDKLKGYMESWNKFCPDYEILRWDETNYDVTKNEYTHNAYKQSKWNDISVYARFDIVDKYGGIYFDTDVELIKPLDDLLFHQAFIGYSHKHMLEAGSGFGSKKKFPLFNILLDSLSGCNSREDFDNEYKKFYDLLFNKGLRYDNSFQSINELAVYPSDFFCPIGASTGILNITQNTYSIHWFSYTWLERGRDNWEKMLDPQNEINKRMQDIS